MEKNAWKDTKRARRRIGIRKRILGTPERPRLAVYKSVHHMYAQIIDDLQGRTLAAVATTEKDLKLEKTSNVKAAESVGAELAKRAKAAGISKVVFDRAGFRYHGRVKAMADAARKGGLSF